MDVIRYPRRGGPANGVASPGKRADWDKAQPGMTTCSETEARVYEAFTRLQIPYDRFEHPPVATVEQAEQYLGWHRRGAFQEPLLAK